MPQHRQTAKQARAIAKGLVQRQQHVAGIDGRALADRDAPITPSRAARISFSIFMASRMSSTSPFFTDWPRRQHISRILPGIGALTASPPERAPGRAREPVQERAQPRGRSGRRDGGRSSDRRRGRSGGNGQRGGRARVYGRAADFFYFNLIGLTIDGDRELAHNCSS